MAAKAENRNGRGRLWRRAAWGAAAALMLLPLLAMQVTEEVAWDVADFAIFAAMLISAGGVYELSARFSASSAYRAAIGLALATAFLLTWVNLAVGIVGTEDDPANLLCGGVLAVGIISAFIARFRPAGMARAFFATALAQALVAAVAVAAGMGYPASPPLEILAVNALFAMLWLASASLFRKAAREKNSRRQGAVAQLSSLFRRSLIVFATATSSQAGSLSLKTLHASPLAASGAPGRRTISPSDCAKMLTMDESWRGKGCATSEPSASSVRRARI